MTFNMKVGTENFSDEEYDENTTYWDKRRQFWSYLIVSRREFKIWDLKKPKLWKKNKSQIILLNHCSWIEGIYSVIISNLLSSWCWHCTWANFKFLESESQIYGNKLLCFRWHWRKANACMCNMSTKINFYTRWCFCVRCLFWLVSRGWILLRVHICLSTARFSSFAPSSVSEPAKVVTHDYEERTNLGGRKQIYLKSILSNV